MYTLFKPVLQQLGDNGKIIQSLLRLQSRCLLFSRLPKERLEGAAQVRMRCNIRLRARTNRSVATPVGVLRRLPTPCPSRDLRRTTMIIAGVVRLSHITLLIFTCTVRLEKHFALTRRGNLCEDNMLDEEMTSCAEDLVCRLRPDVQLPKVMCQIEDDDDVMRFWFEGAVRGNPLT
jgi:hypothetical protein